ncbi:hypothetical protein BDE02_12G087700 [Populus trichocarpa]|nr:hypothetical protein BDE02_12G087700 [Populus trichocarpa]
MPFEVMDHRGSTTASSHYFEDIHLPAERQIGFWNPNTMPDHQELSQSILDRDKKEKSLISEQGANMCEHAWSSMDHHPKSWSSLSLQPASYSKGRSRADISAAQWENSLFSSSFSEIFSRKLRFSGNDIHSHQPAKTITSSNGKKSPLNLLKNLRRKLLEISSLLKITCFLE